MGHCGSRLPHFIDLIEILCNGVAETSPPCILTQREGLNSFTGTQSHSHFSPHLSYLNHVMSHDESHV